MIQEIRFIPSLLTLFQLKLNTVTMLALESETRGGIGFGGWKNYTTNSKVEAIANL